MAYNDNYLIKVKKNKTINANYWAMTELSPVAFYIYCHLLNVNEKFHPSINAYVTLTGNGIKKIRNGLEELKDKGYLEIEPTGYHKYQWIIREEADKSKAIFEAPKGKVKLKKTEIKEKEIDLEIQELEELLASGEVSGDVYENVQQRLIELSIQKNNL